MADSAPSDVVPSGERPTLLIVATIAGTIRGFLAPYAEHFRTLGWDVDAAAKGATADPALAASFDHLHDLPLSRSIRDVRGLAGALRALHDTLDRGYDIVHVHTPIAGFLTRLAIRRMPPERRPAVAYTAHGFHFHAAGRALTNAAFLTAERIAGRWTDRLVVISDDDEAAARRYRIVPGRRLVHMPGIGVDTRFYDPARVDAGAVTTVRRELGIPVDASVFALVGELNRNKRPGDAISALAALRDRDAHLVVAGRGPERAELEAQARRQGVAERVHLLGEVDDIRPVVRGATALLLLSTREGLARSVMEALSLEVPVIASSARGNRELLGEDRGLVYETGDIAGLTEAMSWIVDHPAEARRMGERGRARMTERYDLSVLLRLHEDLYRSMLAERRAIRGAASIAGSRGS
jgi:glycosyltransferase involved in cell wall biosynthesis